MEYKLNFELVPDGCWYSNLRTVLKPQIWDKIRFDAYKKANGRCMICLLPTRRLEAHERWAYDEDKGIQKLVDVIAICHNCHSVIHIGRTELLGEEEKAIAWFQKVNGCNYAEYRKARSEANEAHRRRNLVPEWSIDISLIEGYLK